MSDHPGGPAYPGDPAHPGDPAYPAGPPAYPGGPPGPAPATCYRHRDRRAGVSCQRCNRPICPSCMIQASVGFHCPECVSASARRAPVYDARSLPGFVPYVTYALIAVNVAVFVGDLVTGGNFMNGQGRPYYDGRIDVVKIVTGEWFRLFTAGFLHYGVIHLSVNMFSLYIIGPQLERLLGRARFITLYVASLLAGSLGALLVTPRGYTVGASGAIFGLLGAALAFQLSNKINVWRSGLGQIILLNLFITFSFSSVISVGGHLGGLAGGAIIGYAMFELDKRDVSPWVGVGVAAVLGVACVIAAVAMAPQLIVIR